MRIRTGLPGNSGLPGPGRTRQGEREQDERYAESDPVKEMSLPPRKYIVNSFRS